MNRGASEFPLFFIDEISERAFIISDQNFFVEIRLRDKVEGEFMYWIVVIASDPCYVFLNDACPWSR